MSVDDAIATGFGVCLLVLGVIVLAVISVVFNGWVLSILWNWFVARTLGAPRLTIVAALGIALVFSLATPLFYHKQEGWAPMVFTFVRPALALAMGAILRLFI